MTIPHANVIARCVAQLYLLYLILGHGFDIADEVLGDSGLLYQVFLAMDLFFYLVVSHKVTIGGVDDEPQFILFEVAG
jgi:hypothetical protein